MHPATRTFGARATLAAAAASIAYGIPQLLQVAGLLPDPWDRILIFAPSLLLAPCFVAAMAASVDLADVGCRGTARAAFGLAVMYAVLVSSVYVTQLSVVIPGELRGDAARVAVLACCAQGQVMTGIDLLGYTLMSVALWFLAAALPRDGSHRWLRWVLLFNGWLAFALLGQLAFPRLIYVGALWLVSFPWAMFLLRARFSAAD